MDCSDYSTSLMSEANSEDGKVLLLLSLVLLTEISLLTAKQGRNSEFAPKTSVLVSGDCKAHLHFIG